MIAGREEDPEEVLTQRDSNPYPYTDSNKRYMTYDWYLKTRFGGKVAKVSLDIGCTCPNMDGMKGFGGCIFCKSGSSGASGSVREGNSIEEQYARGKEVARGKWDPVGFIPYFQAHTNTYGDPAALSCAFNRAARWPDAVMISIATRPDALSEEMMGTLVRLARKIPLTVELGLQTSDDETARFINRCHTFAEFRAGYERLRRAADKVNAVCGHELPASGEEIEGLPMKRFQIGVHLIDGLPGESADTMRKTTADVAALKPDMVKLHLLHVLRDTPLAALYEAGGYVPMDRADYIAVVCDQLEMFPAATVIGRVTGDAPADELVAPLWTSRKTEVANEIDKELYRRGTCQGCRAG